VTVDVGNVSKPDMSAVDEENPQQCYVNCVRLLVLLLKLKFMGNVPKPESQLARLCVHGALRPLMLELWETFPSLMCLLPNAVAEFSSPALLNA